MNNFFQVPVTAVWIVNSAAAAALLSKLREYILRSLSRTSRTFDEINEILDELLPFNRTPTPHECPESVDWFMYEDIFGVEFLHHVLNLRQAIRDSVAADANRVDNPDLWYFQVYKNSFLILEPKAMEFFSIDEQDALEERIYG